MWPAPTANTEPLPQRASVRVHAIVAEDLQLAGEGAVRVSPGIRKVCQHPQRIAGSNRRHRPLRWTKVMKRPC